MFCWYIFGFKIIISANNDSITIIIYFCVALFYQNAGYHIQVFPKKFLGDTAGSCPVLGYIIWPFISNVWVPLAYDVLNIIFKNCIEIVGMEKTGG